jgi:hypothetical protein
MLRIRSWSAVTASITALTLLVPAVHAEQRAVRTASRGTVAKGEEATVAVGRRGAAVATEDGAAAVGRRGAVAVGEEGAAAVGRYGGVVAGEHYESHEGWKTAAAVAGGVAVGIAIGTMLSKPPAASTTVVVSQTTYMYDNGVYYARVMNGGEVAYQVVPAPAGAIITTLPAGCSDVRVGGVAYSQCGQTHYQKVSSGYQVVVVK